MKFEAIYRFVLTFFHDWSFSWCTQNCKSMSCSEERFKIRLQQLSSNLPVIKYLKKYLKNVCIKDCLPFLVTITFITYSLNFGNNILYLMPYLYSGRSGGLRRGSKKHPVVVCFPVNSTKAGISPQKHLAFSFNTFAKLV